MDNTATNEGSTSNITAPQPAQAFLSLPLEIRIKVYEYVFGEAELEVAGLAGPWSNGKEPSVTYENANRSATVVCKQMREEARPVLLRQTVVILFDPFRTHPRRTPTPRRAATLPWSQLRWLPKPEAQGEAYSRASMVVLKLTVRPMKRQKHEWQLLSLKPFENLQRLDIEMYIEPRSIDEDSLQQMDPIDLKSVAAYYGRDPFQWVEEETFGRIGGRAKLAGLLDIAETVKIRSHITFQTYMTNTTGRARAPEYLGVSITYTCLDIMHTDICSGGLFS